MSGNRAFLFERLHGLELVFGVVQGSGGCIDMTDDESNRDL